MHRPVTMARGKRHTRIQALGRPVKTDYALDVRKITLSNAE
jgi:hypothetical protein